MNAVVSPAVVEVRRVIAASPAALFAAWFDPEAVGAFGPLPGLENSPLSLPWAVVWQIFVFNLVVKFVVTLVSLPLIYTTPDPDWSQREESDR